MAGQSTYGNVCTYDMSLPIYICAVNRILSAISNPEESLSIDSSLKSKSKNGPGSRYINDVVHLRDYYRATEIEDKKVVGSIQ